MGDCSVSSNFPISSMKLLAHNETNKFDFNAI